MSDTKTPLAQRTIHVLEFQLGNVPTPFRFVGIDGCGSPPVRRDIFAAMDFGSRENALEFMQNHMQDLVYPVEYRAVVLTAQSLN